MIFVLVWNTLTPFYIFTIIATRMREQMRWSRQMQGYCVSEWQTLETDITTYSSFEAIVWNIERECFVTSTMAFSYLFMLLLCHPKQQSKIYKLNFNDPHFRLNVWFSS